MSDHFQQKSNGRQVVGISQRLSCLLCGDELTATTRYNLQGEYICMSCLLHFGPDRARILVNVKKLDPGEVAGAVSFLRSLLTQNQIVRLREAIRLGGRNWWVKLPEFGEYVCKAVSGQGFGWDPEVLDEIWNRVVEEAVEE